MFTRMDLACMPMLRLIRYVLRLSVSSDRLKKREDGDYEYYLKRKWSDGTESIKFSGEELIVRLISLIPPPRMNLIPIVTDSKIIRLFCMYFSNILKITDR